MIRDEMLGEAVVVDQPLMDEFRDCGLGGGLREAARDQALREFAGAVVAAIQQFEGREPGCLRIVRGRPGATGSRFRSLTRIPRPDDAPA